MGNLFCILRNAKNSFRVLVSIVLLVCASSSFANPLEQFTEKELLAQEYIKAAKTFFEVRQYADALDKIKAAIEVVPGSALAYAIRGSIEYKLGNLEKAKLSWSSSLELNPDQQDVREILRALSN